MSNNISRLLITGSNGFLGNSILNELNECFEISTLSRHNSNYNVDLTNKSPVFFHKYRLVIHAAGKAHSIPRTAEEKKQFQDVNVLGTLNLLKGLEKVGLPNEFVFISSVSVYGLDIGLNVSENHPLEAKDAYGLSKIEAEKLVQNWCKKNNVICTILRLPLLVSQNPPGNLGAMIKAIDKGYYFNIGGGKARKSMVLARDIASFIPNVSKVGGTYNLTDGFHPNFEELSNVISINKNKKKPFNIPIDLAKLIGFFGNFLGEKAPINSLKVKKITLDLTFDDSKARKLLNWNPQFVLEYLKENNI
jgi:nucleoside-diphosphate-sugar epimerase